jgi:sec-independent protein translocase protein TatB
VFDIGFWELMLISVLGLVILGPERLPVAIRTVTRFFSTAKSMAHNVKEELDHELKIHELQENLKKAEKMGMENIDPQLQQSVNELKEAAKSVQQPYKTEPQSKPTDSTSSESETNK